MTDPSASQITLQATLTFTYKVDLGDFRAWEMPDGGPISAACMADIDEIVFNDDMTCLYEALDTADSVKITVSHEPTVAVPVDVLDDMCDAVNRMACLLIDMDVDGEMPAHRKGEYNNAINGCRGLIELATPYLKRESI